MEKQPLISVIVPVNNVKKYLNRCVDSLLAQTYSNLEVLLIDDGSNDGSEEICDTYANAEDRVTAFHIENAGPSEARNHGMMHATGKYFVFLDSDDWARPTMVEKLYSLMQEHNTRIAVISYAIADEKTGKDNYVQRDHSGVITSKEFLEKLCLKETFEVSAHGKIYERELFADIKFPTGKLYEDLLTIPYIIDMCDRVAYSDSMEYYYLRRATSIMHRPISEKDFVLFEADEKLVDYVDEHYPDMKLQANYRYVEDTFSTYIHRFIYSEKYKTNIKDIVKRCKDNWKLGLKNPYLGRGKKLQIRMILFSSTLYKAVYKRIDKRK